MVKPLRLTMAQILCRNLPPIIGARLGSLIYPYTLARRDAYPFTVRAQTGSWLKGTTQDRVVHSFCINGFYNWKNWAVALAICSPGDTLVEIGANVGTETVGLADIVGPTGHVYAFEPFPPNAATLAETLSMNRLDNVTVIPAAVGEANTKVSFAPPHPYNSGVGHLIPADSPPPGDSLLVDCVTLDSMASRIGPARLLVMDAEGSEIAVLRGAKDYINRHQPAIVLEAEPTLVLKRMGFSLRDLHAEIKGRGYEPFTLARSGLTAPNLDSPHVTDWLCLYSSHLDLVRRVNRSLLRCAVLPCLPGLNPMTRRGKAPPT